MNTMTSRCFNQDAGGAKRASENGPVFITDRGRPAHVLMTIEDYWKITGGRKTLADMLAFEGDPDFELDLPPRLIEPDRQLDLD